MHRQIRKLGYTAWVVAGAAMWSAALFMTQRDTAAASIAVVAPTPPPAAVSPPSTQPKQPSGQEPQSAQQPAPPAQAQAQAGYVGEDTCLTCHEQQKQGYFGSAHHRVADARTPAAKQGCETCHGPGGKHVEDPAGVPVKRFRVLPADEVNETCTTCHSRGEHALSLRLRGREGRPIEGASVAVQAFHNARASALLELELGPAPDGYQAVLSPQRPGLWEFRLDIRAGGERFTSVQRLSLEGRP